ncbi:hypothetical protein EDD16DRAFT_1698946 [Pisolithus croceorrhizus]|nr:hypothetical protein EDD16DRAFT_1698946 [Pisolithus croceorrhizus]KAI6143506.1 hypothetical protein EDD17DRAFT_1781807 [Pisolithus thermaeus]KAI6168241.1 hypothetical protein EDD17DRAFT_1773249 [Pisolithus thermaeus]
MNINGKPIDKCGPIKGVKLSPIHADPPVFIDHELTIAEVLETSIKVIDLLVGKTSLFGGAGVGNVAKAHGGFSIFSRGTLVSCHQPGRKLQGCLGFWSNEQVHVTFMGLTTTAKYFHNEEGQHAGSKVSAVLGHIPSAVGYQPTLSMDMGGMYG